MFDIIKLLESYAIDYKTSTKGWINTRCVFCDDQTDHLGIHTEWATFHCYKCGCHGKRIELVAGLCGCSEDEAQSIIRSFSENVVKSSRAVAKPKERTFAEKCSLPPQADPFLANLHYSYLQDRGFNPEYLAKKYNLHSCYTEGPYKYRIIIPIYYKDKLVSFTSRDVTGKQKPKYLNAPISNSVLDPKSCIYNSDRVNKSMLILEGPTDVWRIGDGSVCTFGIDVSEAQIKTLIEIIKSKEVIRVRVMFDPEVQATKNAKELSMVLSSFVRDCGVVEYDSLKDPGDMSDEEVRQIKKATL